MMLFIGLLIDLRMQMVAGVSFHAGMVSERWTAGSYYYDTFDSAIGGFCDWHMPVCPVIPLRGDIPEKIAPPTSVPESEDW